MRRKHAESSNVVLPTPSKKVKFCCQKRYYDIYSDILSLGDATATILFVAKETNASYVTAAIACVFAVNLASVNDP